MRTLSPVGRAPPAMLTGCICLEEVRARTTAAADGAVQWTRRHAVLRALVQPKWLYGVFHRGALRCFRRRVDVKLNREPFRIVPLDLQATLVAERQSLIVRSRANGRTLRIRVHPSSSSSYLQWVTALYLARLETSNMRVEEEDTHVQPEKRSKRVMFSEDPSEDEAHASVEEAGAASPSEASTRRETVDIGELFYTREDLERFRVSESHARQAVKKEKSKSSGRGVIQSLVARLKKKEEPPANSDTARGLYE